MSHSQAETEHNYLNHQKSIKSWFMESIRPLGLKQFLKQEKISLSIKTRMILYVKKLPELHPLFVPTLYKKSPKNHTQTTYHWMTYLS